jgi:hypothetical protein
MGLGNKNMWKKNSRRKNDRQVFSKQGIHNTNLIENKSSMIEHGKLSNREHVVSVWCKNGDNVSCDAEFEDSAALKSRRMSKIG